MPDPELKEVLQEYAKNIKEHFSNEIHPKIWYPMFYRKKCKKVFNPSEEWVKENNEKYLKNTANKILQYRWYCSENGAITSMQFAPNGYHIIVGHASGSIEVSLGTHVIVIAPKTLLKLLS